jgi:hypothetical protein
VADRRSPHKTGLLLSTCLSCGRASRGSPLFVTVVRRRRIGGLTNVTILVASRKPNFSLVRAAFYSPRGKPQTQVFSMSGQIVLLVYYNLRYSAGFLAVHISYTVQVIYLCCDFIVNLIFQCLNTFKAKFMKYFTTNFICTVSLAKIVIHLFTRKPEQISGQNASCNT